MKMTKATRSMLVGILKKAQTASSHGIPTGVYIDILPLGAITSGLLLTSFIEGREIEEEENLLFRSTKKKVKKLR